MDRIQDFELDTGVRPFSADPSRLALTQASALLTLLSAAFEDGFWVEEYRLRWDMQGRPEAWPVKDHGYPPESNQRTLNPSIVARAFDGIGTLVNLGIYLGTEKPQ